jgi:hypothetical protein
MSCQASFIHFLIQPWRRNSPLHGALEGAFYASGEHEMALIPPNKQGNCTFCMHSDPHIEQFLQGQCTFLWK